MLISIRRLFGNGNGTVEHFQEKSIVSRFEADVLSVIAGILTQAGTAVRWERDGIGAHELAMHLLDISAGVRSATKTPV